MIVAVRVVMLTLINLGGSIAPDAFRLRVVEDIFQSEDNDV